MAPLEPGVERPDVRRTSGAFECLSARGKLQNAVARGGVARTFSSPSALHTPDVLIADEAVEGAVVGGGVPDFVLPGLLCVPPLTGEKPGAAGGDERLGFMIEMQHHGTLITPEKPRRFWRAKTLQREACWRV